MNATLQPYDALSGFVWTLNAGIHGAGYHVVHALSGIRRVAERFRQPGGADLHCGAAVGRAWSMLLATSSNAFRAPAYETDLYPMYDVAIEHPPG